MTTAYISPPACALHNMGAGHPERPERLDAINDALIRARLMDLLRGYDASLATREQLALVHTTKHIEHIFEVSPSSGNYDLDRDTRMTPHTLKAALMAAGAVIQATDLVMQNDVQQAFCAVRPPGHHAEHDRAMGFCIFNNIAVGVAHALAQYNLQRIAIVDFDVHHGNGSEDIFRNESRVMLFSSFQYPFYPYSYGETQPGHIINVALPAGTTSEAFRRSVTQWLPELEAFRPELVFISAGFDAHRLDPLGQFNLVEDDFAWITREVKTIADKYAQGRIISSLEGGYDLGALGLSVVAHIGVLMGAA